MSFKTGLFGCVGSIVGILFLFAGCTILFGLSYNKVQEENSGKAEITDRSWVPVGFVPFNNNIAYRWSEPASYSCAYGDSCTQMEIVSRERCDSLYAELTKLDASGNNVGRTNETASNVEPMQKAILKFETYGEFHSYRLSEVSCN